MATEERSGVKAKVRRKMTALNLTVSRRQHLQHAALLWILVGTMLGIRGMIWLLADAHMHRLLVVIIPIAAVLGIIKGARLLSKSALQVAARIHALDERTAFWQLFSPSTYLLIIAMMGFGITCRLAGAHWHFMGIIGILYLVVGIALITGSRTYWSICV